MTIGHDGPLARLTVSYHYFTFSQVKPTSLQAIPLTLPRGAAPEGRTGEEGPVITGPDEYGVARATRPGLAWRAGDNRPES